MSHIVLLGDSIFDNAAYVAAGPAVIDQLRSSLPAGCGATLCARDGSLIRDVRDQLARVPGHATHLVLSVGGNDLLAELAILGRSVRTVGEGLTHLADIQERFSVDYASLLESLVTLRLPVVVCTIFNPCFPDAKLQREAVVALCLFNDAIVRLAQRFCLPVIDLRRVCTEEQDYATPIEPSVAGGTKLARAITDAVLHHDLSVRYAVLLP